MDQEESRTDGARVARVRRALRKHGYVLRKSRRRGAATLDDFGEYMIVDADANAVVAGSRFDFTLDDAEAWARGDT